MPDGEEVQELDTNTQEAPVVEEAKAEAPVEQKTEAPKEAKVDRQVWTMPVKKAQEEKQRAIEKALEQARADKESEIQALKEQYEKRLQSASPSSYKDKVKKVAEESGLDPEAALNLLQPVIDELKSSMPDMSRYDAIVKEREMEAERLKVSREFDEKILPIIQKDFPQATPAHILDVKEKIGELAFTEGFNTYRLEDIYKVNREQFEFKNGMGAESPGGRSSELVDFSKMTDEEEHQLAQRDPAKFKEYLKYQSSTGSRYVDL